MRPPAKPHRTPTHRTATPSHRRNGHAGSSTPPTEVVVTGYTVLIVQNGGETLDRALQWRLQQMLDAAIATAKERTAISVVLQSPGGDAHASYKMFLDLRSRCSVLEAIVPNYAKSAATLLTLGMDQVWMAPCAELGPLDVQIPHPDRDGETISGLDARYCVDYLAESCFGLVLEGGNRFINVTGISRQLGLRESARFIDAFIQPIVSKLDPHLMHRAAQQLRVAGDYAVRMMHARNEAVCGTMTEQDIQAVCSRLIETYSTHEFVISRSEAADLGLPIRAAEEHPHWPFAASVCAAALETGEGVVRVMTDSEIIAAESEAAAEVQAAAASDESLGE